MPGELDLNNLVKTGTVELGREEHPDERAARLRREERRDLREHHLFYIVATGVLAVGTVTFGVALAEPYFEASTREWCQNIFTAVFAGGVSFLFGKWLPRN
jgi:hypothetical protein